MTDQSKRQLVDALRVSAAALRALNDAHGHAERQPVEARMLAPMAALDRLLRGLPMNLLGLASELDGVAAKMGECLRRSGA